MFNKIQSDLLKAAEARDGWKHKNFNGIYHKAENFTFVSTDGIFLMGIPNRFFYLDAEKLFDKPEWDGVGKLLKDADYLDEAMDTGLVKEVEIDNKKMALRKFALPNGESAYIDEKYYKEFDRAYLKEFPGSCKFLGNYPKSPIYVKWNDDIVGMICAVNVKGEGF